jgi:hypothetical protein
MLVQKAQEIDNGRQRRGLATLVAGKGIVAAAGQPRGGRLAEAQLAADAPNLPGNSCTFAQYQLVARSRVSTRAVGIELDLAAACATPALQAFHPRLHAGMLDDEGLALEPLHGLARLAVEALSRHRHFSLNWITGAASRNVILI